MIDARVGDQALEINITGFDAWLMDVRRRSIQLTVPISQITEASVRRRSDIGSHRHVLDERRGLVTCAHSSGKILHVTADGQPWRFIRLSVADPDDIASTISAKLRYRRS